MTDDMSKYTGFISEHKKMADQGGFRTSINETFGQRTTALLPATQSLWGKGKVGVADIGKQWPTGKMNVQVAHVYGSKWESEHPLAKPKLRFVVGHGDSKGYEKEFHAHHDQTGAKTGFHKVVNNIHLHDGKVVHKDNEQHINDKASVHVYK